MRSAVAVAHAQRAPGGTRALAGTRRLGTSTGEQVTGSNLLCVRDHNQLLVLHTVRTRGSSRTSLRRRS